MRTFMLSVVVSFGVIAVPAHAKKHKKAHRPVHALKQAKADVPRPVPTNTRAKEEYDSGEAQLAELKASRDLPVASLTNQSADDEVPGQHRK